MILSVISLPYFSLCKTVACLLEAMLDKLSSSFSKLISILSFFSSKSFLSDLSDLSVSIKLFEEAYDRSRGLREIGSNALNSSYLLFTELYGFPSSVYWIS